MSCIVEAHCRRVCIVCSYVWRRIGGIELGNMKASVNANTSLSTQSMRSNSGNLHLDNEVITKGN